MPTRGALTIWFASLPIILIVVALFWKRSAVLPAPRSRWWVRAIGWLAAAGLLGPLLFATVHMVTVTLLNWRNVVGDPARALGQGVGGVVYLGALLGYLAIAVLMIPYAPILMLWARTGPALGWLEHTKRGVAVSAAILAAPAAVAAAVMHDVSAGPSAGGWTDLAWLGAIVFVAVGTSLLLPRILIRPLRPGAFGADPASTGFPDPGS